MDAVQTRDEFPARRPASAHSEAGLGAGTPSPLARPLRRPGLTRRSLLTGAVSTAAIAALSACGVGEGVDLGTASDPLSLKAAIAGEPDQLDPHQTSSYFSFQVLENVFDTLVEPDEDLVLQPALAESWEVSDDQLEWTFRLREGVEFHDGTPLTAEDVVYSYRRIIDEELANAWKLTMIESVEAADDHTVVLRVTAPSPNLLPAIGGFKGLAIVSRENVESGDIQTHPIGTGPFSFTSRTAGSSIVLTANEGFWGGQPKIPGVVFSFISEPTTAVAALRSGEIDWTDSIPPQQVAILDGDESLAIDTVISNDYWYLACNEAKEPYGDERVRRAISFAIDRESIAQATGYGTSEVNQLAIPKTSPWYTEFDEFAFDPDEARSLLAEAGVDSLDMDLMVTTEYPETVTAAQVIAANLADVGITASITQLDFGAWLDRQAEGQFDMLLLGWLGNIDPDDYYWAQHHSEGPSNSQGFSDPKVDELLDAGRVEMDEAKRKQTYDEAATLIGQKGSYIYLYNPAVIQAHTSALSGYTIRSDRALRFRSAEIRRD